MAKCRSCGKPAGLMMSECNDCIQKQQRAAIDQAKHESAPPPALDPAMITTNPDVAGFVVVKNLGVVRGLSVRSRGVVANTIASFETIAGGQITMMEQLCEETRRIAFDRMRVHAKAIGADAITGMHFDANEIGDGITEVLCYGTAVMLAPGGEG